jgi:hypothetical protein
VVAKKEKNVLAKMKNVIANVMKNMNVMRIALVDVMKEKNVLVIKNKKEGKLLFLFILLLFLLYELLLQ